MRRVRAAALLCVAALGCAPPMALAGESGPDADQSLPDRVEELQQEVDSLTEDIEDLQEPIAEFDLFDECMYLIGVSQYGTRDGSRGYLFGRGAGLLRPALALDIRGFGTPRYSFLAFPAEEPPSIECNEDAGQELIDN